MSEAAEPWEVRPDLPESVRFAKVPGGVYNAAKRMRFVVDPAVGTVTFENSVRKWGDLVARLPDRAEPADLPELHAVCIDQVTQLPGFTRLVLTDRAGRCLVSGSLLDPRIFPVIWPPGRLQQLERAGILVREELFRTHRKLNKAHPGAARHWYLVSPPMIVLWCLLALPVVITAFVLAVNLSGH